MDKKYIYVKNEDSFKIGVWSTPIYQSKTITTGCETT